MSEAEDAKLFAEAEKFKVARMIEANAMEKNGSGRAGGCPKCGGLAMEGHSGGPSPLDYPWRFKCIQGHWWYIQSDGAMSR